MPLQFSVIGQVDAVSKGVVVWRHGDHKPAATDAADDDERISTAITIGCWQLTTCVRDDVGNCCSYILLRALQQLVPRRWMYLSHQADEADKPLFRLWGNRCQVSETVAASRHPPAYILEAEQRPPKSLAPLAGLLPSIVTTLTSVTLSVPAGRVRWLMSLLRQCRTRPPSSVHILCLTLMALTASRSATWS